MRGNADTDAREVGPSGVDTHKRGEAPPVVSAALAMAEGTAGVESAGGAEKAIAAKSEALESGAYGEAGSRREGPLHGRAWAALSNQLESSLELSRSLQHSTELHRTQFQSLKRKSTHSNHSTHSKPRLSHMLPRLRMSTHRTHHLPLSSTSGKRE